MSDKINGESKSLAEITNELAEIVWVLKQECDRDWKGETPRQVGHIAASAIYWRGVAAKKAETRAESAEAEAQRLREVLERIAHYQLSLTWSGELQEIARLALTPATPEAGKSQPQESLDLEPELRRLMWLNHFHDGQYGDDGEMQCVKCVPFGTGDYKRAPLEVVRRAYNAALLAAKLAAPPRPLSPKWELRAVTSIHAMVAKWKKSVDREELYAILARKHNSLCPCPRCEEARKKAKEEK